MPSIDHGVASGLWGLFFALFIWFGLLLIKVDGATAFILGWVAGGAIFLFVRKFGEAEPRRAPRRRARKR
jgi:hypothetical protein